MRGLSSTTRAEFQNAIKHLWSAHDVLQTQCPDKPWLLTSARMYLGQAWIYAGESRKLVQHTNPWLNEARAKQDRYAFAALAGFGGGSCNALMAGQPEAALSLLDEAMAPWPDAPFSTNHFGAAMARASALAHLGGNHLLRWLTANDARLERAYLFKRRSDKTHLPRYALKAGHARVPLCASSCPASI